MIPLEWFVFTLAVAYAVWAFTTRAPQAEAVTNAVPSLEAARALVAKHYGIEAAALDLSAQQSAAAPARRESTPPAALRAAAPLPPPAPFSPVVSLRASPPTPPVPLCDDDDDDGPAPSRVWGWGALHDRDAESEGATSVAPRAVVADSTVLGTIIAVACGGGGGGAAAADSDGDGDEPSPLGSALYLTDEGNVYASNPRAGKRPALVQALALQKALHDERIVAVSCGATHCVAVASSGALFSWGSGVNGQLGHGTCASSTEPRKVKGLLGTRVVQAACGVAHTVAVGAEGALFSWGSGASFCLGHGTTAAYTAPKEVVKGLGPKTRRVAAVAAACGNDFTVVLCADGGVRCCGSNAQRQCGGAEGVGACRELTLLAEVSFLLFTVTFHANLAHSLTRSP
jgi:hypothetical protein